MQYNINQTNKLIDFTINFNELRFLAIAFSDYDLGDIAIDRFILEKKTVLNNMNYLYENLEEPYKTNPNQEDLEPVT